MQNEYFLKLREKLSASYIKKYNVTINIVRGKIFTDNSGNLNIMQHEYHHDNNFNVSLRGFNEMSEIIIIEYNIFDNELYTNYKYDIHFIKRRLSELYAQSTNNHIYKWHFGQENNIIRCF